jgi:adenosylhomocysteine nucleosidase
MIYILVALEPELPEIPDNQNYKLVYTGVGKINAAIAATVACLQSDCQLIINYGTAGALNKNIINHLVAIGKLYQRDMDARPLVALGYTPFESDDGYIKISDSPYTLSTGDNFVTYMPEIPTDAVDMEAYAIAKVCKKYNMPFECYKYMTDFADENASEHWRENMHKGAEEFIKLL